MRGWRYIGRVRELEWAGVYVILKLHESEAIEVDAGDVIAAASVRHGPLRRGTMQVSKVNRDSHRLQTNIDVYDSIQQLVVGDHVFVATALGADVFTQEGDVTDE